MARKSRGKSLRAHGCPTPTDAILESISDGVFTVDRDWRVTSFNRTAEEITETTREEAIGRAATRLWYATTTGIMSAACSAGLSCIGRRRG